MTRTRRKVLPALLAVALAPVLAGCGSKGIEVAANDSPEIKRGAQLFAERCSGCHTLTAAGAEGSAVNVNDREYKDGPNFNVRKEEYDQILYAIRNGGFSSGPMPQNIAVGQDAEDIARFLEKYSGQDVARAPTPGQPAPEGF